MPRAVPTGLQAVVDYQGFTTQVETTVDIRGLCRVPTIQDGKVRIDDAINGRRFTQTADGPTTGPGFIPLGTIHVLEATP